MNTPSSVALSLSLSLCFIATVGCGTDPADPADGADDCFTCAGKADTFGLAECEIDRLLAFASSADEDTLDHDVALDARAARGIAGHGDFATLGELDAVPFVGPFAFARLIEYTEARGLLTCSPDAERCLDIEGAIDDCQGLHGLLLEECIEIARLSLDELETCCEADDLYFFCSELSETIDLTEGDPNTEFGETFLALQDAATGDCMPFGGAFFYEPSLDPSDVVVANTIAGIFSDGDADIDIDINLSADRDLAPFLESFGFDLGGLHGAIGFDGYQLARVTITTASAIDDVMVLHYHDSDEVWTVSLSCER